VKTDIEGSDAMRRTILIVGAAAVAVAGGGAAVAASKLGSPQEESKAVVDDAAEQLGISPSKLSAALKKALENRVDAAVAAGRLTKEQGDAVKKRIESQDYPALGGLGIGFGHRGGPGMHGPGHLDAAASYLGITPAELGTQLQSGKSLADVAKANGKSVDGLVAALVADEKTRLDAAVKTGRITQAQADQILATAKQRVTDMVNGKRPERPTGRFGGPPGPLGFGPRHRDRTI
jgi:hypothetical protein